MKVFTSLLLAIWFLLTPCSGLPWEANIGGLLLTTPVIAVDRVLQSNSEGVLVAVNRQTGATLWARQPTTSPLNTPEVVASQNLVVTSSTDGRVYAHSLDDGSARWTADTGSAIYSQVAVDATRIYCATSNGDLLALNFMGQETWRTNVGAPILAAPAISGDTLFVYLDAVALQARSITDGSLNWAAPLIHFGAATTPLVTAGLVLVPGEGSRLFAFDAMTGGSAWTAQLPSVASTGISADATRVFIGSADGSISAFTTATGTLVWQANLADQLTASPVVDGTTLLVGGTTGGLTTLEAATGTTTITTFVSGPIIAPVAHEGTDTFVALATGTLISLS